MVFAKDFVDNPAIQEGGGYSRENKKCKGDGPYRENKKCGTLGLGFFHSVRAPQPRFPRPPRFQENQVLRPNPLEREDKRIPQVIFFFYPVESPFYQTGYIRCIYLSSVSF